MESFFNPVCQETVPGESPWVVLLIINREDIFDSLSILGNKMNNLFSNIEHVNTARSELISTLKSTITYFKEEYTKLTDSLRNYVDFTFQH